MHVLDGGIVALDYLQTDYPALEVVMVNSKM